MGQHVLRCRREDVDHVAVVQQSVGAVATGRATVESVELRDLKKRNRLSDQENEVHRAAAYLVRDINQI
jgi:hypothetical protein